MKEQIQTLIDNGWLKEDAIQFVKSIASDAYNAGSYSGANPRVTYEEFEKWFEDQIED